MKLSDIAKKIMEAEDELNEIPGQFAQKYNDLAKTKIKKKDGGEVTAATAAKSDYAKKDPATHKKAKSFLQKVKDKLTKKKDDKPKKQSKSDADFYKRQFAGESIMIDGKQYHSIKESDQRTFKENYDKIFRSLKWNNY